jgi:hypothetical protein
LIMVVAFYNDFVRIFTWAYSDFIFSY